MPWRCHKGYLLDWLSRRSERSQATSTSWFPSLQHHLHFPYHNRKFQYEHNQKSSNRKLYKTLPHLLHCSHLKKKKNKTCCLIVIRVIVIIIIIVILFVSVFLPIVIWLCHRFRLTTVFYQLSSNSNCYLLSRTRGFNVPQTPL